MVVGLRILVSARLLVSAADLYGGAGLRERASACFLAGVGDYELSQHLAHHRLHLRHGSGRLDRGTTCTFTGVWLHSSDMLCNSSHCTTYPNWATRLPYRCTFSYILHASTIAPFDARRDHLRGRGEARGGRTVDFSTSLTLLTCLTDTSTLDYRAVCRVYAQQ